ncbi:MAG: prephenate dehydrogenase [Pseudomonadales bacterium]
MVDSMRVGIVGLGLIGGSIAAGLKAAEQYEIHAHDLDSSAMALGESLGIVDQIHPTLDTLPSAVDVLMLATPVRTLPSILPHLAEFEGVLTDVGSVKQPIVDAVLSITPQLAERLVPGHPVAGSERHGVGAADANLFRHHKVILTPLDVTQLDAIARIQTIWTSLGAEVVEMSVAHHDDVLAQTSHLPHLLAYTLVDVLAGFGDEREVFEYAAGGFRDFSRIAASDPEMWRDIFLTNKEALLRLIETFSAALNQTSKLIEAEDAEALTERLTRAKAARDYFTSIQPKSPQN